MCLVQAAREFGFPFIACCYVEKARTPIIPFEENKWASEFGACSSDASTPVEKACARKHATQEQFGSDCSSDLQSWGFQA